MEPRQRDVRDESARRGGDADAGEQLIDLAVERGDRFDRVDPRPYHTRAAVVLEPAHPGDACGDGRGVEAAERRSDVLGAMMVDLADEAQRQVQLLVVLPAGAGNPMHRGDQQRADGGGRAQGNKQAVRGHGGGQHKRRGGSCEPERGSCPVSLESDPDYPDIVGMAGIVWPMME